MLKGFNEFINEETDHHLNLEQEVDDIRQLFDIGMVDQSEFIARLLELSDKYGVQLESILRPTDRYYDIQVTDLIDDDDLINSIVFLLDQWRGPRGEAVCQARGTAGEDWLDLDIIISNGVTVKIDWSERISNIEKQCYAQVDGVRTYMNEEEAEEALDAYYDYHSNWDLYIQDLITLLVKSTY